MKTVILFAVFMLVAFCGFSQFNYKFNYQAVVRNGAGTLVPKGSSVGMRVSILEGSTIGTVLYQETHNALVNNDQGLVNLVIGDGTPSVGGIVFSGNFQDLTQEKFLKIEADPAGGTSYTDLGATKLQFVPYAAHAFTATLAENGTQWENGAASSISYAGGNVNIGTSTPSATASLSVEKSITSGRVVSIKQTGASGSSMALYAENNTISTGGSAINGWHSSNGKGVYGGVGGNGSGVYGTAGTTGGVGVEGNADIGVKASSFSTNGIAIELDGFMKVSGTKTAFKTSALVSAASNITLSYGGASSTDIILVTPVSSSYTMPSWELIWNISTSAWQIWNASDDGIPSNFPAGTSFNVLIIKQ